MNWLAAVDVTNSPLTAFDFLTGCSVLLHSVLLARSMPGATLQTFS
jgi:hypothetical protein